MRTATAVLVTGLVSVAICSPAASAEPAAPPEAPSGGVVFVDTPAIVDPHPMRVESWSRAAGDNAINVNFTSGTDTCYGVQETGQTVTVDLQGGPLPEAIDRACIMIALFGTLEVPLEAPLGDRRVLSAA
jgi:uncharacterized membrane protein